MLYPVELRRRGRQSRVRRVSAACESLSNRLRIASAAPGPVFTWLNRVRRSLYPALAFILLLAFSGLRFHCASG